MIQEDLKKKQDNQFSQRARTAQDANIDRVVCLGSRFKNVIPLAK